MDVLEISQSAIDQAIQCICAGGVIAHATETCYGFACNLTNEDAVRKLFQIKQRPFDQPVSALFASVEEAKKWVEWGEVAEKLAREHLPGPLTVVVSMQEHLSYMVHVVPNAKFPMPNSQTIPNSQCPNSLYRTLGIRISSHLVAMELARRCGFPLSTTSANLHGKPNPYSVEIIVAQYRGQKLQPDIILDSGSLSEAPPSTVIDASSGTMRIVRQGSITISDP